MSKLKINEIQVYSNAIQLILISFNMITFNFKDNLYIKQNFYHG